MRASEIVLLAAVLLLACCQGPGVRAPESPHAARYEAGLTALPVLTAGEIESAGRASIYSVPMEELWPACLETVTQYGGVLAINGSGSERTLLLMHGLAQTQAAGGDGSPAMMGMSYDRWLAVSVSEREPGRTQVSSAIVSASGQLQSPGSAGDTFLFQLGTQLTGERRWFPKYQIDWARVQPRDVHVARPDTVSESEGQLERRVGAWVSRRLRDDAVVVNCPELDEILGEIVRRLRDASGYQGKGIRVRVLANPELHAFALPNGDVFVCSGLLDALTSTDELAAVLAHEMDHLCQHDVIHRLSQLRGGRMGGVIVSTLSVAAGAAIGMQGSGSTIGSIAQSTVQSLGTLGASHLGTTLVANYSEGAEMRADRNGASVAHAAGFRSDGSLVVLEELDRLDVEARESGGVVVSNLVNKKPGIAARIRAARVTVAQLRDHSFDPAERPELPDTPQPEENHDL
ncbi:MAG: Zn-dependent protease with chaperone function [Planctomycetota bacterium]|jgi:Zn-dependent protease with chaperone function